MIDFDALVLGPCLATFAIDVRVEPAASQPGMRSYAARGVYDERPVDVDVGEGQIFSSAAKRLGVRYSEFSVAPQQGDFVTIVKTGMRFRVEDLDDDGQGGTVLTLAEIRP